LRLSSRPPKAGTILDPALTARLTEAASASLTAEAAPDRWGVVLEAVAFSPVRLAVAPRSRPETPSDELIAGVTRFADRVPQVAAAFDIQPAAPERRKRAPRKPAARKAVPPPPPLDATPAAPSAPAPASELPDAAPEVNDTAPEANDAAPADSAE
jgi:hypothetical protein